MMLLWSALVLGLAGSAHCLGMCGPLVMAVHASSGGVWWHHVIYHTARIFVYAVLGALAGLVGGTFVALGWQRWLVLVVGIFMLLFVLLPVSKFKFSNVILTQVSKIKQKATPYFSSKPTVKFAVLGAINGLLPCGLVYVALAASIATGNMLQSAIYMSLFGLGTSPVLMATSKIFGLLSKKLRLQSMRAVQISLVLISVLIMLRGAGLGIPLLSPSFDACNQKMECCAKH